MPGQGQHIQRIKVAARPVIGNVLFFTDRVARDFVDQFRQIAVGPRGVDGGVVILVLQQFARQIAGVIGRKFDVHGQAELDGGGADGHQRANIAVGVVQLAFLDVARRIGGEHVVGSAEFLRQQRRQVNGAVQALAIELAEATFRLFGVAQEHQGLGAVHRLCTAFAGFQRQEQRADRQQGGQGNVGAMFEAFGETHQIRHEIKRSSACSVKADKPLHRRLPAPGVFHVMKRFLCNKGIAQSPPRPFGSIRKRARHSNGKHSQHWQRIITECYGSCRRCRRLRSFDLVETLKLKRSQPAAAPTL